MRILQRLAYGSPLRQVTSVLAVKNMEPMMSNALTQRESASLPSMQVEEKELTFMAEVWETVNGKRVKRNQNVTAEYPEWCRVTVERIVGSDVRRFTAREYWLENYATKSNKTTEPNAMWKRRPYGQLAKCA